MTDPGGIQLLPETRRALEEKRPNESRLLYISIAIGALIFAAGFGLNYYKNSLYNQVTALNDKFAEIEKGRDKELEAGLKVLSSQLGSLSGLLKNHIIITKVFHRVELLLNEKVSVGNISVDMTAKKIAMKVGAPSYTVVARQLASFLSDEAIIDVNLGKLTRGTDGRLEFTLDIGFDNSKIIKK